MLHRGSASGTSLPALLMANYAPAPKSSSGLDIQPGHGRLRGERTTCSWSGGASPTVSFGIMGTTPHDCAPTSGFVLEDPAEAAQRCAWTA